jgi:cysteine-rich repeat protein
MIAVMGTCDRCALLAGLVLSFGSVAACQGDVVAPAGVDAMIPEDGGANDATGADGDASTSDAELYPVECGNDELEEGEVCDDGDTSDGDGCSADCTSDESCGNGVIDEPVGEVCDDGNTRNGDGCSADCTSDESCGNGAVDLGVGEVCDDGNTADDDGCSADCMTGPSCGDGVLHPPEACDDGNTGGGDGCSADCTSDESCGNGTVDGDEACDDGGTAGGDGCSAECQHEGCGDGDVNGEEACDDGNMVPDDGCENDCTLSCPDPDGCADPVLPSAFRITQMRVREPHLYSWLFPTTMRFCTDITGSVSSTINENVADYGLNYMVVFRPLAVDDPGGPVDFVDGECVDGTPDACTVGTILPYATAATNLAAGGTCFDPAAPEWAAVRNDEYTSPNTVSGPCFVTDPRTIVFNLAGVPLTLLSARIAATYSGGVPPTNLVSGVIAGFVTSEAAKMTRIPEGTQLVGGKLLYELLADGRATGSSCSSRDDSDLDGTTEGFWFIVDFTAEAVDWSD